MDDRDLGSKAAGYRLLPARRSVLMDRVVPFAVKAFFMVVLHTPLHPILSSRWASLEFTGRRSGKIYRTPIAYYREGDRVWITTGSRWWLNLQHGARVRLLLRLRAHVGAADQVTDPAEAARRLRQILDAVPTLAYPGDVRIVDGRVSDAELDRVIAAGRKVLEIRLQS
ncbi:nitroreductase/quinone reductase family protein [Microlunatus soli]|uniref:Deazaflavin-dependent oxidoreductase, nitroreductase family n=1 Tax=Microlunatus soli TaxID=630515 RepID=A0A1H1YS47_9ACTN|nr:nitroreductase/quinone reductase family protein [Microlunatus soli]SDT24237.1 deazaflavin-dependent oxidoreductase, nitroreductase family [Microlunatus soli]